MTKAYMAPSIAGTYAAYIGDLTAYLNVDSRHPINAMQVGDYASGRRLHGCVHLKSATAGPPAGTAAKANTHVLHIMYGVNKHAPRQCMILFAGYLVHSLSGSIMARAAPLDGVHVHGTDTHSTTVRWHGWSAWERGCVRVCL